MPYRVENIVRKDQHCVFYSYISLVCQNVVLFDNGLRGNSMKIKKL